MNGVVDLIASLIDKGIELAENAGERDVAHKLARARAALHAPIDTSADDAARRAELDRILKGVKP